MGDDFRRMECCREECNDKCIKDCYCNDNNNSGIWLIILIIIIYCLFCNDNKGGGLFGGLF